LQWTQSSNRAKLQEVVIAQEDVPLPRFRGLSERTEGGGDQGDQRLRVGDGIENGRQQLVPYCRLVLDV
jgi:hypothetical protein